MTEHFADNQETKYTRLEYERRFVVSAHPKHEVTEDPFFTGGNLCRTGRTELLRKLSALK